MNMTKKALFDRFLVDKLPDHRPLKQRHRRRPNRELTTIERIQRINTESWGKHFGEEFAIGANEMRKDILKILREAGGAVQGGVSEL